MSAGEAVGGIYPIVYAFFDGRGRIDRALMQRQVEVCLLARIAQDPEADELRTGAARGPALRSWVGQPCIAARTRGRCIGTYSHVRRSRAAN